MRSMKKVLALLLVLCMIFSLAACATKQAPATEEKSVQTPTAEKESKPTEEKPITLKVASTAGPTLFQTTFAEKFGEYLFELSGGTMKVEVYHSGSLGNTAQIFSQLSENTLDLFSSGMDTATALTDASDFNIFSMPYAFDDVAHIKAFTESDTFAAMNQKLIDANHVMFGGIIGALNPRGLSCKDPIATPEDLTNLKIRVPESTGNMAVWTAWGANPVSVPWSECYTSMESGIVDGQDNDIPTTYNGSIFEVNKYYTELAYISQCVCLWMSEKSWNALSEQQQAWFKEAVAKANETNTATTVSSYDEAKQKAKDEFGVTFVDFDKEAFQKLAADAISKLEAEHLFSEGLYEKARELAK